MLKAKPKAEVSLMDDDDYRRAGERLQELHQQRDDLERRRQQALSGLHEAGPSVELAARAERLLADGVLPLPTDAEIARLRGDLVTLTDQLAVVRQAIELQRGVVQRERVRVSAAICQRLRPQHRAIVLRIATALEDLGAALEAERTFREALNDADVIYGHELRPMPIPALGLLSEPHSALSRWLAEAREAGLLG